MDSFSKSDTDRNDDKDGSDADMLSPSEDMKEINGKKKRNRKRRREIDLIKSEGSNDDDSESEDANSKRNLSFLGSPTPHSPGHSAGREPRSCVLNQRQKRKPLSRLLEHLLRNLEKKDQNQFFAWPVTDNYAPNYSTIIKRPMDFSTMKQKIDDNMYRSLNCFISDFKLMCNNAVKYNKSGTVYHKAARKLLHLGMRQLTPAKLRPLGSILTYMYEIPIRELGFDMGKMDVALKNGNSSRESQEDDTKEPLSADDMVKLKMEAVREQHRKRLAKKAFPRMDAEGFTSLQVLVDNDGMSPASNKRPVSLGVFTGRIAHGTGTLQGFKEDRRNAVKGVKPLNYGAFGSYAPSYDSTFATISKEESHILYHIYGEETGISANDTLLRFSTESPWNCIYNMEELFPCRNSSRNSPDKQVDNYSDVKVDIDQLKTLSEIGIDVDFLADIEDDIVVSQQDFGLKHSLHQNVLALKKLENEQKERLSQPIPPHLSNVAKPSLLEQETARTVVHNLKEMVSQVKPQHVVSLTSIRKAMGVTLAHLDTPMTLEELHEISPEHALMADQLLKENANHLTLLENAQNSGNEDNSVKSESESSDRKYLEDVKSEESEFVKAN
ncbi:bromodomain-containing protein 7-like isoform X2 [Arctopsyche grandis]|uniref:bromodomain-containing protein 7-like isoform X2 n=1 Tax=Arctopsyche grandis TaxID=121162 RepID=UPI00406D69A8